VGTNSREEALAGTLVIQPRLLRMAKPLQHQIISRALEIISDDAKWTRVSLARTADGKPCTSLDPSAVRFCAVGALYRAASELLVDDPFDHALVAEQHVLAANHRNDGLQRINDIDGREVIVAMFRVALAQ
jgi:hypothetical protein